MSETNYFTGIDVVDAVRIDPLTVEQDGVYTAPTGTLGYNPVTVNVSNSIDYSTTEQDTGSKWIDGKPIYQKTFIPTAPATSWDGTNNSVDVSGLNIDTLINVEAQAQNISNGNYYPLSMVSTPSNTIVMTPTKSDILIYLGDNNIPTRVFNLTIQYTKTTDTVN